MPDSSSVSSAASPSVSAVSSSAAGSASSDFEDLDSLAYARGRPQTSARLKQAFSDFRVDEQLGFKFSERGEHLVLQIEKTDHSTVDVAKKLSEVSGVHRADIGYAGMKDRRAQTKQWFSIKLPKQKESAIDGIESESLRILARHRNSRKITIGSHRCNHFQLRLRNCQGSQSAFEDALQQIASMGVPNYFGSQRFGRGLSNMHQVQAWMRAELGLGTTDATASVPRQRFKRSMLFSAARSYLFNQVLSKRLQLGNWASYVEGDVLNLDGTDRCFALETASDWDQTLAQRLLDFDIHLTGPLPGLIESKDKYVSYGKAADIEDAVCKQFSTLMAGLQHFGLKASRRPLRFLPSDLHLQWLPSYLSTSENSADGDEPIAAGKDLLLDFSLGKGAYATSLLR